MNCVVLCTLPSKVAFLSKKVNLNLFFFSWKKKKKLTNND